VAKSSKIVAPDEAQLEAAYQEALTRYASRSEVTGIDIGYKYSGDDNRRTGQVAVRIHVVEKFEPGQLQSAEMIRRQLAGVLTDVIAARYRPQSSLAMRRAVIRPVRPGVSIGRPAHTDGTLGLVAFRRSDGAPCLVSNWHVLSGVSPSIPRSKVTQPGGGDQFHDHVAGIDRVILDIVGDAASAVLKAETPFLTAQFETDVVVKSPRRAVLGETVEKSGVGTGTTRGIVDGIGRYFVDYNGFGQGPRREIDGFRVVSPDGPGSRGMVSDHGDSGSCWYSPADKSGIGLHFAGEPRAGFGEDFALAAHLSSVLDRLDLTLDAPPASTFLAFKREPEVASKTKNDLATPQTPSNPLPTRGRGRKEVHLHVHIHLDPRMTEED